MLAQQGLAHHIRAMRPVATGANSPRKLFLMLLTAQLIASSGGGPDLQAQEGRAGAEMWGRVIQSGDTMGLPGALIEVEGLAVSGVSSQTGFYRLAGLRPGPHVIRVRRLGYRSVTLEVELPADHALERDILLEQLAAHLTAVRIEGQLRQVPPRFEDVYRRMTTAHGKFFTREDIESLNPPDVQSLLMRVSTARVNNEGIQFAKCDAGGAFALSGGGKKGGRSSVQIYIDGYRMTGRIPGRLEGDNEQRDVLKLVNPSQIQAMEIYSGVARIPGEFLDDACAVIAIWTKSY